MANRVQTEKQVLVKINFAGGPGSNPKHIIYLCYYAMYGSQIVPHLLVIVLRKDENKQTFR